MPNAKHHTPKPLPTFPAVMSSANPYVSPPRAAVHAALAAMDEHCDMCAIPLKNYNPSLIRRCNLCDKLIKDWTQCTRWFDLLNLNREFIDGERTSTPYAVFPMFDDNKLIPALLRLHDYGLLVTDAQDEKAVVGKELSGQHMGKWYEVKERAYLTCVLPTNDPRISKAKIDQLICLLFFEMTDTIEHVSYYEYEEYGKGSGTEGRYIAPPNGTTQQQVNDNEIERFRMFYSSVGPSNAGRVVAKHRWALTEEELKWKKWKKCHHNELPVVRETDLLKKSMGKRAFGHQLPMTLGMKPLIITLAIRDWPPTGQDLPSLLLKACVAVGLEPVFAKNRSGKQEEGLIQAETPAEAPEATPDAQPVSPATVVSDVGSSAQKEEYPFRELTRSDLETMAMTLRLPDDIQAAIDTESRRKAQSQADERANSEIKLLEKLEALSLLEDID
ncbi:hypothetical protein P280DRAFT_541108 [Massarina eburnea CBS 473.64]|uniref:Uncharacterized protein n=1 Tax=Massarina eburnea CBS 473.64 TaxID=1395130 RepID=A0A6A6S1H4_9PLEO|nr:hypothetical protein P280DRAFT_541108 [Massarina eburnea CBS 473.64]